MDAGQRPDEMPAVPGGDETPTAAAGGVHDPASGEGDGAVDDDEVEIPFRELAVRAQTAPLPPPTLNPPLLPFSLLDPEVFERVVAEIVFRRRDHLGTHFYGRRGQKQHGLDIVEQMKDGGAALYQVKRYQQVDAAQLRRTVEEYAGPPRSLGHDLQPRRFDPRRFVVVTSAEVDRDTANVDEATALRRDYAGDLDIEVWGAEALSRTLRDAPGLVAAVFGRPWAEAFCGSASPEPTAQDPRPLGLVEEPVEVLGLAPMVMDAQTREQVDPAEAASLYAAVASELDKAAFPGHAALMRTRQAAAARAAGDSVGAFETEFRIALARVARGDDLRLQLKSEMKQSAEELGGVALAKFRILSAAADWPEQGTDLGAVADPLAEVAASADSDAAQLYCTVLEQALVDGLFEFDPPRSMFADTDAKTPAELGVMRDVAAGLTSSDPVLRARLRCAAADAALKDDSTRAQVEAVYGAHLEDAAAGRLLHAGGLVASRAAFAFATHGAIERAENLWRQSVLVSSEQRLYGDARNALRAIQAARGDIGQWMMFGLDTVVRAMPNRRRLIEARHDVSLSALEAAHERRLPDAFGATRRWLWEARLSGHLVEERLAWRLLGRVLAASGHPAEAVECFVLAGEAKTAVEAARPLPVQADTWRWTKSPVRRRRAAAIQVASAQAGLVGDDELTQFAGDLLTLADGLWEMPWVSPNPQLDAIRALAALGVRIPATAVDRILVVAQPAVERLTRASDETANLLVQTYWSVAERRADLAPAIAAMLRQPDPPHGLWDLVEHIPPAAQDPLLPTLLELAEEGNPAASAALVAWRRDPTELQLAARRACASLLRRPVGHDRQSHSITTQEAQVADLLLGLLDAVDEVSVSPQQFAPGLCPPVGGVIMVSGVVADDPMTNAPTALAEPEPQPDPQQPDDALEPDDAARTAAAPREQLLVAVADKLLALAEDIKDIAASRRHAILALHRLLPQLPGDSAVSGTQRLVAIHDNPELSERDRWEIETNTPLSRSRIDTGAGSLSAVALIAAAEAFRRAGGDGQELVGDADFASRLVAAALPLLRSDATEARFGARVVAAVAGAAPALAHHATAMLFHSEADVRAAGARHAPIDERVFLQLTTDPAAHVRAAAASRGSELPVAVRDALAADADAGVRLSLERAFTAG
jgi:hypothetical protein